MKKLAVFENASNAITNFFGNVGIRTKQYSPEILMGLGVASIIGGTILACKATLKASDIIEQHDSDMATIAKAEDISDEYVNNGDAAKDKTVAKVRLAGRMALNYAPAVVCIGTGIAMICASHGIMKKREAGLMAAYQAVDTAFRTYRKRVVGEEGDAKDQHYLTGADYIVQKDEQTGENKLVKVKEADPSKKDPKIYAKFFDEASPYWKKDPWLNLTFLRSVQLQLNKDLERKGYVFLNELYELVGIEPTPAGQLVGWVRKDGVYIDLGIYDVSDPAKRAFVNGYERSILLNPNVQGVIYDML